VGTAIALASKAFFPPLAKAIGGKFEKGYSLSRFDKSIQPSLNHSNVSSAISQSSPAHPNQGMTPGINQAISTTGFPAGFRAKVNYK
jgi:hypothetical protein